MVKREHVLALLGLACLMIGLSGCWETSRSSDDAAIDSTVDAAIDAAAACATDETRACYGGPEGTEGVGACRAGVETCLADRSGFGPCVGEVVPAAEVCDGLDNDCNVDVDDVDGVGEPCVSGIGACEGAGTRVCDLESGQIVCDIEPGQTADEVCDGIDNDCDGTVDEVDGIGEACTVGVGACQAMGANVCGDEGLVCDATAGQPAAAEVCSNQIDDDCDGETDEPDCIAPCVTDEDCGPEALCEDGVCVPGDCRVDPDCEVGAELCEDRFCTPGDCRVDPDCEVGAELCEDRFCTPGDCRVDPDCEVGAELCEDRFCTPGDCRVDADCAAGARCLARFCSGTPDACLDPQAIGTFSTVEGNTADAAAQAQASCGGADSPEIAWALDLDYEGAVCLDTFGSAFDTVLSVRGACDDAIDEIACNDDIGPDGFQQSQLELQVAADATYTIFVDGGGAGSSGDYTLTVREGSCALCATDRDCPGTERCATQARDVRICVPEHCGDGVRDATEGCDDGRHDAGDGCSPRCEIEEGYGCWQPPEGSPTAPFELDGRLDCGPENAVPTDGLTPWPTNRGFYVDGSVVIAPNGLHRARMAVLVDGERAAGLPDLGTARDAAGSEALYAGWSTGLFAVDAGEAVAVHFPDASCNNNEGMLRGEIRPVDACFPVVCTADPDCFFGMLCLDGACVEVGDFDGDGVPDNRDLDDDGDGIPDTEECLFPSDSMAFNGSFERPAGAADGDSVELDDDGVPGWSAADGILTLSADGFDGIPGLDGRQWAVIDAADGDAIFQDVATPGVRYDWTVIQRGAAGEATFEVSIGPPDAPDRRVQFTHGADDWQAFSGTYVVPVDQDVTRFTITALDGRSQIDAARFMPRCDGTADADGDGISNHLDDDSDGDGRSDAREAGHGLANSQGDIDRPLGNDGWADLAESAPDSGDIGYELADTDEDGLPDFLEPGVESCLDLEPEGPPVERCWSTSDEDFDGLAGCADDDCADDVFCVLRGCDDEPNEDIAGAAPRGPGGYRNCRLNAPAGDRDVFAIDYCAGGRLEVGVGFEPGFDLDLILTDGDGNPLAEASTDAAPETLVYADGPGGVVFLEITTPGDVRVDHTMSVNLVCPPEVCDDGVDNDLDGKTDCLDIQCREAPDCAIDPVVYIAVPQPSQHIHSPIYQPPTVIYGVDARGEAAALSEVTVAGEPQAVTAIALSPTGRMVGVAIDNFDAGVWFHPMSTALEIDPLTGAACPLGEPWGGYVTGAAFDAAERLWILMPDRNKFPDLAQVRELVDGRVGDAAFDAWRRDPTTARFGGIAIDAPGNGFATRLELRDRRRPVQRFVPSTGASADIGVPVVEGYVDRSVPTAMAFALDPLTCTPRLWTFDGVGADELGVGELRDGALHLQQTALLELGASEGQFDMAGFPSVANTPECAGPEVCDDGFDNDGDGAVDCRDPACAADPACQGPAEVCDNEIDDDDDGVVDCVDTDCLGDPACQAPFCPRPEGACVDRAPRRKLMHCGFEGAFPIMQIYFTEEDGFEMVNSCEPDDETQALVISSLGNPAAPYIDLATIRPYLERGGVVITPIQESHVVYHAVVGCRARLAHHVNTEYPAGFDVSVRYNEDDPFWRAHGGVPPAEPIGSNRGDLSTVPYITPMGGTVPGIVNLGYLDVGEGRLWMVEAHYGFHPDRLPANYESSIALFRSVTLNPCPAE